MAGAGATGGSGSAAAQPGAVAPRIEPVTVKAARHESARSRPGPRLFAGFTLFSRLPSSNKTVYLIDMQGSVVHTRGMPYPPGQSGYLTDRGTLFYNGQIPNDSHVGRAPYRGGADLQMTWDGRILWEVKHPDHNHDGIRLRNGNIGLPFAPLSFVGVPYCAPGLWGAAAAAAPYYARQAYPASHPPPRYPY